MKSFSSFLESLPGRVTPCVGVWIEIPMNSLPCLKTLVTPCVGVWIEIPALWEVSARSAESLPAWECGLKYDRREKDHSLTKSLPAWECGLKSESKQTTNITLWSLPAWECGLKSLCLV